MATLKKTSPFANGFTKENLSLARSIMNKHLQAMEEELGITKASIGNISYNPSGTEFSCKLTVLNIINKDDSGIKKIIGGIYRSQNKATKYILDEIRANEVIVQTIRGGGKYKVPNTDFENWIKIQ